MAVAEETCLIPSQCGSINSILGIVGISPSPVLRKPILRNLIGRLALGGYDVFSAHASWELGLLVWVLAVGSWVFMGVCP